jgi:hypothetical protein
MINDIIDGRIEVGLRKLWSNLEGQNRLSKEGKGKVIGLYKGKGRVRVID